MEVACLIWIRDVYIFYTHHSTGLRVLDAKHIEHHDCGCHFDKGNRCYNQYNVLFTGHVLCVAIVDDAAVVPPHVGAVRSRGREGPRLATHAVRTTLRSHPRGAPVRLVVAVRDEHVVERIVAPRGRRPRLEGLVWFVSGSTNQHPINKDKAMRGANRKTVPKYCINAPGSCQEARLSRGSLLRSQ